MCRSIRQDSSEKIILQGRSPRDFSGHSDACHSLKSISVQEHSNGLKFGTYVEAEVRKLW